MNDLDSPYLFVRDKTRSHDGFLRNVKQADPSYDKILNSVFAHQVAVYGDGANSGTPDNQVKLADYFYRNCYIDIPVKKGDEGGYELKTDEFIKNVVLFDDHPKRNHLSYLLGEIGIGKTAFINSLISRYGCEWVAKNNMWFVRIDLEVAESGQNVTSRKTITAYELLDIMAKKILKILQERPVLYSGSDGTTTEKWTDLIEKLISSCKAQITDQDSNTKAANYREQVEVITKIVAEMRFEFGRKLFLIIDNIDYICHLCDRSLFDEDGDTKEIEILAGICQLAGLFYHDASDLGKLGANILFVMRPDSYQVLAQAGKTSLPEKSVWDAMNAYVLSGPKWEDVLDGRGKLLAYATSFIHDEPKRKSIGNIVSTIRNNLISGPPNQPELVVHLQELTNHSLREMMFFFSQYSWIGSGSIEGEETLVRFARQYPVALLAFMLGRHRRFSQWWSNFPNIYLINSQKQDYKHGHTYWLKRLMIELLAVKQKTNEHFPPERIIEIFRGKKQQGYEDGIIRECLGSFSEANKSDLLRATRTFNQPKKLQVDKLFLTPRGYHCSQFIFDRFFYLQLVVDDFMLPIPRKLIEYFQFTANTPDYAYIVYDSRMEFHNASKAMIRSKMKQVLLFLYVLRCALEFESNAYPSVFDNLANHGVAVPNVDVIIDDIVNELRALTKYVFSNLEDDVDKVRTEVEKLRQIIYEIVWDIYVHEGH